MGLALRRTELLIEAAQLSHYVQSLRGPAGYPSGALSPQQGWTPYLTAHLKLTLAVPRGGTFFLLISLDSSLPQFTGLVGTTRCC